MNYAPKIVLQLPLSNPNLLEPFVEACLRDGVSLIAVVGEGGSKIENLIDKLVVGDGSDRSRFIVTTSHPGETVEEVMEYARSWDEERDQPVELVKL
jgi:flagellar biosynthesis/type III secretory pathway ATPase